ncbi:MAG TPA: preprotein translocase subunit SecY [Nanoarchaeota archaeon]|nr:preprotein translocase subunit SecY [Nanoarchaeota archaeon]
MAEMPFYVKIASMLPSIERPAKRLTLKEKLKWTGLVLILFFAMGSVTIYGINPEIEPTLKFYEIIFGSTIGSIITLGIAPIVTASIILQMLVGSKIIPWDLRKEEDKIKYSAVQKLLIIFFCFFESLLYVFAGIILPVSPEFTGIVILQIALGGIIVMYFDELVTKWGIGSGVSLFIAAGVSKTIFLRTFMPPLEAGVETPGGVIFSFITNFLAGELINALFTLLPLISTLIIFIIVAFSQGMRVEIPIAFSFAFGKLPARKWSLRFFYTSNIPVILTTALLVNINLFAQMLYQKGITILGTFENGIPTGGIAYFLTPPNNPVLSLCVIFAFVFALLIGLLVASKIKKYIFRSVIISGLFGFVLCYLIILMFEKYIPAGMFTQTDILRAITYLLAMIIGSTIFSIFWVNTAGMDPKSVAEQFKATYLSIPGFRRDPRIIEKLLEKYIPSLTVLGGAFVGFIAGFADLTGAIGTGTGILLTAMIITQFYETIVAQHLEDMHPALRKFVGG